MTHAAPPDYLSSLLQRIESLPDDQTARLQALAQAADTHAADPRPLVLLGAELIQQGALDQGEVAYAEALRRAPGFAIARFQLGLLQVTRGRPEDARMTWAALDLLEQEDPLRLFKTGLEHLIQDRFEEARLWIFRGIEKNQVNAPLNRDMQMVLARIANAPGGPAGPEGGPAPQPQDHVLLSAYRSSN